MRTMPLAAGLVAAAAVGCSAFAPTAPVPHGLRSTMHAYRRYTLDGPPPSQAEASAASASAELLKTCSGLDRGAAATSNDVARVNAAVAALEAASPCSLTDEALVEALAGRWRLVYTSAFTKMAPAAGIGSVYQQIYASSGGARLDNQVEFKVPSPLPLAPSAKLKASLQHSLVANGETLTIKLLQTKVRLAPNRKGNSAKRPRSPPAVSLPSISKVGDRLNIGYQLRDALSAPAPVKALLERDAKASTFSTTVLASDVRVSRGGLDELRVFVRMGN